MQSLREMVSPKFDTKRWIPAPANFTCHNCEKPQKAGSMVSWIFTNVDEWDYNAPDCTECEMEEKAEHEIDEMWTTVKSRSSELDFNEYTKEYWERQAASPVPTEFDKLVRWVGDRHDLLEFQKILATLQPESDDQWFQFYLTPSGEVYDDREEVDFYKSLRFADLPAQLELSVWDQVALAAVREIDPNHPIVAWLG